MDYYTLSYNCQDLRIKNRGNSIMKLPSHDVQYTEGNICSLINQPRSVTAKVTMIYHNNYAWQYKLHTCF